MISSPRARTGLAATVLCAARLVCAADGADETRAIERAVSDDPRVVLREAAESERKALASGDRPAQLRALRLSSAASLIVMENERAQQLVDRGLPLARALGEPESVRAFLTAGATLATSQGRFDEALKLVDEAIAYARSHGLTSGRAKSLAAKADVFVGMMRLSDALTLLDEAWAVFEKEGDRFWMSEVLSGRAHVHGRDPEDPAGPEKAAELHARANAMLDPRKQRYACAIDYVNLGGEYSRLGRQEKARDYLGRAVSLGRELDDPMLVAHAKYRLGAVEAEEGHDEKAVALFQEALPVFARNLVTEMVFGTHLRTAGALARLGRGAESLRALAQAEEAAGRIGAPDVDIAVSEARMKIHEQLGDAAKALTYAKHLREAERKEAEAANSRRARELGLKFEVKQKESENSLLRAQARVAEVRRLALVLALALLALALTVAGFVIVRQRRRQRRLVTLAMRDELTGLPNRRAIQEFARLQFDLHRRLRLDFSVGILDIDNFKAVNDAFGHATGDAVLVAFAQACRGQLRGTDSFGRYGGDEFLLVMPGVDASEIPTLFGRLRQGINGAIAQGLPEDAEIRFSLGVAQATDDGVSLDELLSRADRALYKAKEAGRDRFFVAASLLLALAALLAPAFAFAREPSKPSAVAAPVLKWQRGGCFASWCETGWYSSPAAIDVDGDGKVEVIWGSYGVVILDGATGALKWRDPNGSRVWPGIAVADLTGNGSLEVIVGRGSDQLTVYDSHLGVLWARNPFGQGEVRTLAVSDLESDGQLEIVVGCAASVSTRQLNAYDAAGSVRSGWPARRTGEPGYGAGMYNENVAVGDLDGDGNKEVIGPTDTHYITALDRNGNQLPAHAMYGAGKVWSEVGVHVDQAADLRGYANCGTEHRPNWADSAPVIADVDGDGTKEIVVVGNVHDCFTNPYTDLYQMPFLLKRDRTRWSGSGFDWTVIPTPAAGSAPLSEDYSVIENDVPNPVVVDLDGDGRKEILFSSYDGKVHAYWLDRTEHGSWPYDIPGTGIRFASEPVVADLDGDGNAEVLCTSWPQKSVGGTGQVHVLDYLGNLLQAVDLPAPYGGDSWNGALGAPTLADVDADGELELVVGTVSTGVVVYDLPGTANARVLWGTGRGGLLRNGVAAAAPSAARFYTLPPCRLVDTRNADGALGGPVLAANAQRLFTLTGTCGVPAGAKTLSVNAVAVPGSAGGHLTLFPGDAALPVTTSLDFRAFRTRANNALVLLATDGSGGINVQNAAASATHFVLDVNGYFR